MTCRKNHNAEVSSLAVFAPTKPASAKRIVKGSKFIANIAPAESKEEAIDFIKRKSAEYKNATHNVPCYCLGSDFSLRWASDDGEPGGTAGTPILSLLLSRKITNVAIVVTRYFGGVKLGAGGLAKAYASSVKLALDEADITELVETEEKEFTTDYKNFDALKYRLEKEEGGEILAVEYGENIKIKARLRRGVDFDI
jgi:uncharacterized YigZ family protein